MLFWLPGVTAIAFCGKVKYAYGSTEKSMSCINHIHMTHADHEQDCEGMMAHYFFFVSMVNQYLFYFVACIFTKLTKTKPYLGNFKKPNLFNMFGNFQFPLLNWLCIKYNYHFKIAILIQSISSMANPVVYFFTLVKPESKTELPVLKCVAGLSDIFPRKFECPIDSSVASYTVYIQWHWTSHKYSYVYS